MTFETDLYGELSSDPGVAAIVSDRIYPSHAADGADAPYVVYTSRLEPAYMLSGAGNISQGFLQIDCYAEDPDTAAALALAVIAAMPESGPLHRTGHRNHDLGMEEDTRLFRRMVEMNVFHRSP